MALDVKQVNVANALRVFWRYKFRAAGIVFVVTLGAVLYSYTMAEVFEAQAAIIPVSSQSSSASSSASLLSNVLGGGSSGGQGNLLMFLKSQKLTAQAVHGLGLFETLTADVRRSGADFTEEQLLQQAVTRLQGMVEFKTDRFHPQIILVKVRHTDPEMASKIIRQYLTELQNFISNNTLTQAKRHRIFLEEQIAEKKKEILELGKELAAFYGKGLQLEIQAKMKVPISVKTKSGIRNLKNYEEFKMYFEVLKQKTPSEEDSLVQYVDGVPHQVYLQYITNQQQILDQSYATLIQSYELARIDEAKQEPSFQVLDEPITPKYRVSPQRRVIAKGAFGVGMLLAMLYVAALAFGFPNRHLKPVKEEIREHWKQWRNG